MASWQELAGGEKVAIGEKSTDVYGIGIDGLNLIAQRFPEFIDMIIDQRVDLPLIVRDFPKACAVVLAAGVGQPGNEACEKDLARLPLVHQITLLEAIIRQTVGGDDPGPFVEKVKRLAKRLGLGAAEPASETSPTNSQGPSSISKSADTLM